MDVEEDETVREDDEHPMPGLDDDREEDAPMRLPYQFCE
jgi:hypothetical protein